MLGGFANICHEYATKRYRSNCINWGIFPFTTDADIAGSMSPGDWVYVPSLLAGVLVGEETFAAKLLHGGAVSDLTLHIRGLSDEEKQILAEGCLMNYYAAHK